MTLSNHLLNDLPVFPIITPYGLTLTVFPSLPIDLASGRCSNSKPPSSFRIPRTFNSVIPRRLLLRRRPRSRFALGKLHIKIIDATESSLLLFSSLNCFLRDDIISRYCFFACLLVCLLVCVL